LKRSGVQPKHRRSAPPVTFASELARVAGLRQVRFAIPAADYPVIDRAKRRFGAVGVTRLFARLLRELVRLCPRAGAR
jgi:hypothetical protein